ncbi:hypothetical protein CPB84DRAFT_1062928 [Gymnopilus junonius]|uniref:F-box domain-containing protein n=1 Tax=Gymnopilus junonius TaxID=109634 RepID=A0A9P5NYN7_GYMJU|nr:hypothetical protein CPB84DRAFT_1062928 [Gymnopilus junonius]
MNLSRNRSQSFSVWFLRLFRLPCLVSSIRRFTSLWNKEFVQHLWEAVVEDNICGQILSGSITIADLPNEILVQIFLFTTEPTNGIVDKIDHALISKTPICSPKTMASPFPLSQVCQLWRQIILDTKAMWRSIALSNPTIRHVHRVELWMERVKNHTIDILIHLNYPHTFPSEHHDAIVQIFEFLGRRATTWRSLEFGTSHFIPPPLITSLRGLSTANSSCLRRVTVSTPLLERPVDELWAFLHNIQSIEMLWWRGPHVYRATRSSSSRLQFLELSGISKAIMPSIPTFLVNTLSPFANLEELFINFQFEPPLPTSSQDELPRPIVFRKLRRLTIGAEIWLKDFAERFTAPALQYLNVRSGDTLYVDNFLRRSRCVLTEFIMHSVPAYRFGDLFDLSVLQSVTSLALYGKNSLDLNHLVKLLHCPPQASTRLHDKNYPSIPYFPNLQHLTLNGTVMRIRRSMKGPCFSCLTVDSG